MARNRRGRGRRGGRQANPRVDQARDSGSRGRNEANPSGTEAGNRNGHNYGDDSRVGQSHPTDIGQAGPHLADEADSPLRQEFEALGIQVRRAEPVFLPRTGYGAAGTPRVVRTIRFVDETLHQYDVTISSPEPTLVTKLVSESELRRFTAYDGRDSLFTAGALPFDTKEVEVTLSASGRGDERVDRKYKVVINHATANILLQLRMLLAGYSTDIHILRQELQFEESVLLAASFNERNGAESVVIGTHAHTLDIEVFKGLYLRIRSTPNVYSEISDVPSSVFIQLLLLIDFVQKILEIVVVDRNLTKPEYDLFLKAVRGMKIEVTHQGNKCHKYRIAGLTVKPTNDLSLKTPGGTIKAVIDHFSKIYSLELKYKTLPCIEVGNEQIPMYLPIEVCKIVPRQCYLKAGKGFRISTLRELARIQPEPEQSSHEDIRLYNVYLSNDLEEDELYVSVGQLTGEGYIVLIDKGVVTFRLARNFKHIVGRGLLDKATKVYMLHFFNGSVLETYEEDSEDDSERQKEDQNDFAEYDCAKGEWVLDSGCHNHITCKETFLAQKWKMRRPKKLQVAGLGVLKCKFKGNVKTDDIKLKDVYLSQNCTSNLISVSQLDALGYNFLFTKDHCIVKYKEEEVLVGLAHLDGGNFNYYVQFLHLKE